MHLRLRGGSRTYRERFEARILRFTGTHSRLDRSSQLHHVSTLLWQA